MRWFGRRERREVDIDPVQLVALRYLARFGPAPMAEVRQEVTHTTGMPEEMVTTALADLVAQGVIDFAEPMGDSDGAVEVALTELGERLRERLPESARSRIRFYV